MSSQKDAPLSEPEQLRMLVADAGEAMFELQENPNAPQMIMTSMVYKALEAAGQAADTLTALQATVHRLEAEKGEAQACLDELGVVDESHAHENPLTLRERIDSLHMGAQEELNDVEEDLERAEAANVELKAQLTALSSATAEQRRQDFEAGMYEGVKFSAGRGGAKAEVARAFAAYLASEGSQ